LPGALSLHFSDEIRIHRLVPNHMHKAVDSCFDQLPGVVEVEDVCQGTQTALVRFLNDRGADFRRHFGECAELVVHSQLDEVGALVGLGVHFADCGLARIERCVDAGNDAPLAPFRGMPLKPVVQVVNGVQ
jgi:hypothetical protein